MKISVVLAALCLLFAGALAQKCFMDADPKAPADWKKDGEVVNPMCAYWDSRSETCNFGCFYKPQPTPTVTATATISPIPTCNVPKKCELDSMVLGCGQACGPYFITEGFNSQFCMTTSWAQSWFDNCKSAESYNPVEKKCEPALGEIKTFEEFASAINGTTYLILDNENCFNGAATATLSALAALVVLAVALF